MGAFTIKSIVETIEKHFYIVGLHNGDHRKVKFNSRYFGEVYLTYSVDFDSWGSTEDNTGFKVRVQAIDVASGKPAATDDLMSAYETEEFKKWWFEVQSEALRLDSQQYDDIQGLFINLRKE